LARRNLTSGVFMIYMEMSANGFKIIGFMAIIALLQIKVLGN